MESFGKNCGTAIGKRFGGTFSAVSRSSYGHCGLIGSIAGRYQRRWINRSTFIWTWSTCARRRPHKIGS